MPPASRAALEKALRAYLDLRIAFYSGAEPMAKDGAKLQSDIWAIVRDAAAAQPTPIVALAVAGANDVLNAQGYAAAWANRIPEPAWQLMALIAAVCSGLLGFGGQRFNAFFLLLFAPATISVSFLLIAEIDSPRGGLSASSPPISSPSRKA